MPARSNRRPRHSFSAKVALAAGLVILADTLFYGHGGGSTLGAFALALLAAVVLTHRQAMGDRRALTAMLVAAAFGLALIDQPKLITLLMFACALGVAALSARARRGDDAWRWAQRLVFNALAATIRGARDVAPLVRAIPWRKQGLSSLRRLALLLILPLGGGAIFLWLFAAANPVIEEALAWIFSFEFDWRLDVFRTAFWLMVLIPVWGFLRPWMLRKPLATPGGEGDLKLAGVTTASVTLALLTFNLLFALQNGLDIAFLWSGAGLPDGMTLATYAHRGAYPLIATALLAGLFVLLVLAPGSATSRSRPIRWLVVLWIAQNILLVVSTMLRTIDYIEVYSLTRLRIAALAWMVLVAIGLVLICWRMLRAKSASWLINANVLAAGAVLATCSVVDLGAIAAAWNVRHAAEVGGRGAQLDFCYLERLGDSALVPLARLEERTSATDFGDKTAWVREGLMVQTEAKQADWRTWTWRSARRLAEARTVARRGKAYPYAIGSRCNESGVPRASLPPAEPAPLVEVPSPDTGDYEHVPQAPLTSLQPR